MQPESPSGNRLRGRLALAGPLLATLPPRTRGVRLSPQWWEGSRGVRKRYPGHRQGRPGPWLSRGEGTGPVNTRPLVLGIYWGRFPRAREGAPRTPFPLSPRRPAAPRLPGGRSQSSSSVTTSQGWRFSRALSPFFKAPHGPHSVHELTCRPPWFPQNREGRTEGSGTARPGRATCAGALTALPQPAARRALACT